MIDNIVEITDNGGTITFTYADGGTTDVTKSSISDVSYALYKLDTSKTATPNIEELGMTVITYGYASDEFSARKNITIDYRIVTSPAEASASDLYDTIVGYAGTINSTGLINRQVFTSTALQTDFIVTEFTLTDEVSVFVNGSLVNERLYSRSGNTITFTSGQADGVEVVILN